MTPFELFFSLTSVILGLALAELASSLQRLLRAGRRIDWSPEPVMQAILILLIIVSVWADQWNSRELVTFTVGESLLQVTKMLALFVAAAAVLPDPDPEGRTDLRAHYLSARAVTYGAMIVGLMLFYAYRTLFGTERLTFAGVAENMVLPLMYGSLIAFRWRPLHLGLLAFVLIVFTYQIVSVEIGG